MFWNRTEVMVAWHFECTKHHWIAHFLMVKGKFYVVWISPQFKNIYTFRCGECYEEN